MDIPSKNDKMFGGLVDKRAILPGSSVLHGSAKKKLFDDDILFNVLSAN